MSEYNTSYEFNPTPTNQLVALVTKIEELIANEPFTLAMSALVSAALRLETCKRYGDERKAAKILEAVFKDIATKSDN
jgi:hypothetical protein